MTHKAAVDKFILTLKNAKREFMRNKYFNIYDQERFESAQSRLTWLKAEGYIEEEEMRELLSTIDPKITIKGF